MPERGPPPQLLRGRAVAKLRGVRALAITYERDAGAGVFLDAAKSEGVELEPWLRLEEDAPPRPVMEYDAVLTFGGSMHPDEVEEHPWIEQDRRLLAGLLEAERPLLGVCLGAQILTLAAGGEVRRLKEPEIGWTDVVVTEAGKDDALIGALAPRFEALEWHSYGCTLPPGATELARNDASLQAWRAGGTAWAIQFHAEVTRRDFERWIENFEQDSDAVKAGVDPTALAKETRSKIGAWNQLGRDLCARFLQAVEMANRM